MFISIQFFNMIWSSVVQFVEQSVHDLVFIALLNRIDPDRKASCASFDTSAIPFLHLFSFKDCSPPFLNSQSAYIPASSVVALYLQTTCSGSISDTAYRSLSCLEQSADQSDQKLIQHLKNRISQGSISVVTL